MRPEGDGRSGDRAVRSLKAALGCAYAHFLKAMREHGIGMAASYSEGRGPLA